MMQVQVHTDSNIQGSAELTAQVENIVVGTLDRFADRITRVEVHLADESSSAKARDDDKRCVLEARLAGMQPITVTNHASTIEEAIEGAADKMETTLKRTLGKLNDPKGRPSYSGD